MPLPQDDSMAILLLPGPLEGFEREAHARGLLRIPRVVALEASKRRTPAFLRNALPMRQARTQIQDLLARLGIKADRINRPLEHMSRGMQQKVAIARAFLSAPILLLLDEPTTGLDPRSKQDVQTFVRELRDTHDATILLTTHDMDEADALCDRIAIIDGGRIVAEDTPEGLKRAVGERLGLDRPATLTEAFMAFTGRDWEADEPEGDDEDDE